MTYSEADVVFFSILGSCVLLNLFKIYLSLRQVKVYKNAKEVPAELKEHMDDETFHKARVYGLDKENFTIFKILIVGVLFVPLELYFGLIAVLWQNAPRVVQKLNLNTDNAKENEIVVSSVFVLILKIFGYVKDLPFKIYRTFVLEQKHGFNKQTPGFFAWDELKDLFLSNFLAVKFAGNLSEHWSGQYFLIYLWAFTSIISLVYMTIYPIFIAPLFDKYTPLEEGELRTSIETLAAYLNFPLSKLYVVEESKRSSHSNAYVYGLWNSKRIVLCDTLLLNKGQKDDTESKKEDKGCTNEEVLAVLGHELGHWKLGHVTKNIIIPQINLLLLFFVFNYFLKYAPFYEALGFAPNVRPILVGFVIITYVMAPFNDIFDYAKKMLSRRFEYQADEFAQNLGLTEQMQKALIKLNLDNLDFPIHDWLYSSFNHSHPSLFQRMHRLDEQEEANKKTK